VIADRSDRTSRRDQIPADNGMPSAMMYSFAVNGMPCSGGSSCPFITAVSACRACAIAASNRSATTALILGFTVSMRAMCVDTTSTGDTSRARILRPSSIADISSSALTRGW
jgi:hypothetical protein